MCVRWIYMYMYMQYMNFTRSCVYLCGIPSVWDGFSARVRMLSSRMCDAADDDGDDDVY